MSNVTPIKSWSKFQENIFAWWSLKSGSAIVKAVAGSGKTTTIVEMATRIDPRLRGVFVAFSKEIVKELASRLPGNIPAKTLNGVGHSCWAYFTGSRNIVVEENKSWLVMDKLYGKETVETYGAPVKSLVAKAKAIGLVPAQAVGRAHGLVDDTDSVWLNLIDHFDIDVPELDGALMTVIKMARETLTRSIEDGRIIIDYDDQLYLPVVCHARFFQNDFVIIDEAQDISPIQRAMLRLMLKRGGRLVAVGDPRQAIFGFRGADSKSLGQIAEEFDCEELPLTVSWRCPIAVVERAKRLVPYIEAAPGAKRGAVKELYGEYLTYDGASKKALFRPTDLVVCRNTKPLVEEAYALIRAGVAITFLGRDIGQGLVKLIEKMKAKTLHQLEAKLGQWLDRETAKFRAKRQDDKIQLVEDKVDTLSVFINQLDENERTIPKLIGKIENLFTDTESKGRLTLATGHRSKGLERPRVFVLNEWMCPSPYAKQPHQIEQEENLLYVMWTRAQEELWMIDNAQKRTRPGETNGGALGDVEDARREKMDSDMAKLIAKPRKGRR